MNYLFNRRKYVPRRNPQGAPLDLADATITVASSVTYTGNALYPSVVVVYEGATLVVNTDYMLNYADNVNVGNGTVTITGMGGYTGSVIKTFAITSAPPAPTGGWPNFDLSNLSSAVASASIIGYSDNYNPNKQLNTYSIQVLSDGRLFFAGQKRGRLCICGFEDGHPFEVEHFTAHIESTPTAYLGGAVLKPDGTAGVQGTVASSTANRFTLSTAFDISARSIVTPSISGFSSQLWRMAFSADGTRFFYKAQTGATIYWWNLSTAYDISTKSSEGSASLNDLAGISSNQPTWRAFFFSPDGIDLIATSSSPIAVHKFTLSTAWDLSSGSRTSYKTIYESGQHALEAVAINAAGTKMILFDQGGSGDPNENWKFYEYDLTT